MMKVFKIILAIVMVFALAKPLSFANEESKVSIGIHKEQSTLTPYTYVSGAPGFDVMNLVFDKLFIHDENNEVIPWMVEKDYKVSEDYKSYEFKLVDGQNWHDGKELTSEDIKFSFEYALTQNQSSHKKIAEKIESIEIKDKLNFTIVLKETNMDFINDDLSSFYIVAKHIYENEKDATKVQETIGSSLYKLVEYKVGQYYKFESNEEYFKGKVNTKHIYMPIITDSTAMFQAILKGEIATSTMGLSPELMDTFKGNKDIEVLNSPGFTTTLLQFNTEREILGDSQIRNAIAHAIDIEKMNDIVNLGYAKIGNPGFFSNELDYSNKNLRYEYNIEKANEILENEGFKLNKDNVRENYKGEKLSFELLVYSSSPLRIRSAELIKDDLSKIGIEIKISSLDATTVDEFVWPDFDVASGRDYDMAMWGWSASTQLTPTKIIALGHSDLVKGNLNVAAYKNEEFDKLADELETSLDIDKRNELMQKLQEILAKDLPFITLSNSDIINVYNKNLGKNWVMQKGMGIINKFSFLNNNTVVKSSADSKNSTIIVGASVVGLCILGTVLYLNKKKRV
ncbi:MAG: ABC transporter substrate-binding protein [Peptostreptococcaceae bacterium]